MKGVRDVVCRAHGFVGDYTDETGGIPADKIKRMGHMLAHCGMENLMTFLRAYKFRDPGHFETFLKVAAAAGITPESTRNL